MTHIKRLIIFFIMLAVSNLLPGCQTSSTYDQKETQSASRLELSVFLMNGGTVIDTNVPVLSKAAEITNISLKNTLSKSTTDVKQAFEIMMASNQKPDIVSYKDGREDFFRYGAEGDFVALNDLIEENAPHIKAFLDSHPDIKRLITAPDGKIYFVPFVLDGTVASGWFIRKDWLDKLGLPVPENPVEYYNTLVAFRDKDPNGNGLKDEIPYFNRNCSLKYQDGVYDLYSIWNVHKEWYVKDGKVYFGAVEPEFKAATESIAKWYAEKLIDPEIFLRGANTREDLLAGNIGGSTHDWFGSTAAFNDSLKEKLPGFNFVVIPPLGGVEYSRRDVVTGGWGMTAANTHPIETMRYFDFWYTQQGRILANYGVEGQQYEMVNGKPQFKDSVLKSGKPVVSLLYDIGAQLPMGYQQDFEYEKQWLNPTAMQGISLYTDNNYIAEGFPKLTFTEEESKRYYELFTAISEYRDEMVRRWILDDLSVENSFDEYLEKMKAMKIDELTGIVQEAYTRYMNGR